MDTLKSLATKFILFLFVMTLYACGGSSPSFDKTPATGGQPTPVTSASSVASATPATSAGAESSSSNSVASSSASIVAEKTGAELYAGQCASCHGDKGQGGLGGKNLKTCASCSNLEKLIETIDTTMPLGNQAACDLGCSTKIAQFIRSEFVGASDSSASSTISSSAASSSKASSAANSSTVVVITSSAASSKSSVTANSSSSSIKSSTTSNSSSIKSSVSSSATASSVSYVGDATRGKTLYENTTNNCVGCHGAKGGGLNGNFLLDATKTTYKYSTSATAQELATYINDWMPAGNATLCTGQCGYDIAAYIRTWVASSSSISVSSSSKSSAISSSKSSSTSSTTTVTSSSSAIASSKSSSSSSTSSAVTTSKSSSSISSVASSVSADILFSENFESTSVNSQPSGWSNLLAYNYNASNTTSGSNYALVDNSKSHTGNNSIHFKGNFAQILHVLPANTQRIHMRAWVNTNRQIGNIPGDDATSNHSHIMGIKKTTDANDEVRVGEIKGTLGTNQVPSDDIAPRNDKWRAGAQISANTWTCVEVAMYGDTAYDELYMWVDGSLVHSITAASDWQNNPQPANWLSDKFNYVEFGFQSYTGSQTADVWMDDLVVSTKPIGCSTSAASSSSSSAASSSSSSSSATADIINGEIMYGSLGKGCNVCHGEKGDGLYKIDPTKATYTHTGNAAQSLESYISDWMPQTAPGTCTGDCARNAAAYIRSWVSSSSSSSSGANSSSSSSSSSSSTGSVNYGPRNLRVLTRSEFSNSIFDLTGVNIAQDLGQSTIDSLPSDAIINNFSNNVMTSINSGMLQSYNLVASTIVEKLATQNYSSIVDCTGLTSSEACGAKLLEQFAPKVFRRPLTDAEIQAYTPMFTAEYTGGDTKEGIKLALKTLFTSPQFLYRDETGISAAEIANGATEPQYEATGTVTALFSSYPVQPGYNAGAQPSYTFTGNELFDIVATGTKDSSGNWPTLNIATDGKSVASIKIDASYEKHYKILVTTVTGQYHYFNFVSSNGGCSSCLVITSANVSGAKKVEVFSPVVLDSDAYMLDQYQLASFLSFTFTGSTPDSTLMTAAAAGQLQTNDQIGAQVTRLIATTKAKAHFGDFAAQWLRADRVLETIKDPTLYPGFTLDVRKAMAQEVRSYYTHVVLDEGEAFTTLFDGSFTFMNEVLANFYGVTGITGSQMRKVTNVTSRAGLVTSGAFMAVNAHDFETAPILRAVNLRRAFLCHDVPAPPTGVSLNGENVDALREKARVDWEAYLAAHNGKATSRKKYEFQTSATLCQTCHKDMINPLGGGMEDFDSVGRPQAQDYNQLTIDSIGSLIGVGTVNDGQTIAFTGAKQLAQNIATLDATRQCFIDNNFRLALGTSATYFDHEKKAILLSDTEKASYTSEEKKLEDVMKANNNSTKAMLKALGSMDSVRYRKNVQR